MRHPGAEHSPAGHPAARCPAAGHPLDRPGPAPLWRAFHDRLSTGQPVARVRTGPLDEAARSAVADLLGLDRLPGPRPALSLTRLDQALRDSCGEDTRSVVTAIVVPVGDRAALWEWLAAHPVVLAQPALDTWDLSGRSCRAARLYGSGMTGFGHRFRFWLRKSCQNPFSRAEPLPVVRGVHAGAGRAVRVVVGHAQPVLHGSRADGLNRRLNHPGAASEGAVSEKGFSGATGRVADRSRSGAGRR